MTPTPTATPAPTPAPTPTPCVVLGEPDADCDGASDDAEKQYGTDPEDPKVTPEHWTYDILYNQSSCFDGKDNDGDGDTDAKDQGCQ